MTAETSLKGGNQDIFQTQTSLDNLPDQRHKDSEPTPLKQQGAKRPALEPSPLIENEYSENIRRTIEDAVRNAMKIAVAQIVTTIKAKIQEFIQITANSAKTSLGDDVMKSLQSATEFVLNKSEAILVCNAELLETYKRKDNVKIYGVIELGARSR